MQDNSLAFSLPLAEDRCQADSSSTMARLECDASPYESFKQLGDQEPGVKEESTNLLITAEVLSSIRKRFFLGNMDSDLLQDLEFEGLKSGKKCKTDSEHEAVSPVVKTQQNMCKYRHLSTQELSLSIEQESCNSQTSDSQHSPDSTFLSLSCGRTPKDEVLSDSFELTQMSNYSDGCGSSLSDYPFAREAGQLQEKPQSKSKHILPPCRVCGDKASGFHYGANTCEACKGFFRRSLKKETIEYKCNSSKNCVIQKGRRNNCPLCRYNKCLSIGMSRNAIKTGRYTHEKRTKDIVEVKQLSGDFIPVTSQPRQDSDSSPTQAKPCLSPDNEKLLVKIFSAHKLLFPFWHKIQETGQHLINMQNYAEKYQKKKSMPEEPKTPEALEVDWQEKTSEHIGDRSSTIHFLTKHIELAVMVFVKFAKAIPGFCDLSLNDQATLVKMSRFEVWMVGAHQFFNCELDVVSGPRGNSYHREELCDVLDSDFVSAMFTFSKTLQNIHLSNQETALIKTVVLTFSDRSTLQDPAQVDQIQLQLISCLEALVNSGRRFSQIMSALVNLRDLTEWHKQISENMVIEWPTIKRHPLLLEIMSV